jgi:CelD/BcsL family acetyltransferase involved in cellulose biosynthesis
LKLSFEEELDEATWKRLLEADPAATPFHTVEWLRAWSRAYPHFRPGRLLARREDGTVIGGLPVFRSIRAGLTQLLSLPYGAYGGPVADAAAEPERAAIRDALIQAWIAEARKPGVMRAHLVLFGWAPAGGADGYTVPATVPAGWRRTERTRILDLTPGFERLWTEVFGGKLRTKWRRAEKLGVEVTREEGEATAREAERLYRSQAEAWSRHTPFPASLFVHLAEAGPERVEFWIARRDGRVVSVQIVLRHGGRAVSWATLNAPEARDLRAGVLATGAIIQAACRRGDRSFNFGSSRDLSSVDSFKASFGGDERSYPSLLHEAAWFRPLHRLYYRARGVA